ncbi:MAG TPA: beta-propeller domain-containing protein [Rhizomicrobium sp.]|nr:beta-propeller domain-containing protein [Rhizomicrobium sp.]
MQPIASRLNRIAATVLLPALAIIGALSFSLPGANATPPRTTTLKAFKSDADLKEFLVRVQKMRGRGVASAEGALPAAPMAGNFAEPVVVTAARASDSITNTQVSGVDEGDIVKLHGDTLVILRRGRLFTVSVAGGGMKRVGSIAAYPPGTDARADWYDEMLISGDRVIVIGYSYGRGGTEINRFHLDAAGHLSFEDAYQMRSNDYYSSRNYASRLIGTRLVLYAPRYLPYGTPTLREVLPAMRRWNSDAPNAGFEPIGTSRQVYMPPSLVDDQIDTIHTITSCDLSAPVLHCMATSVLGSDGRVFYVSSTAVYVWVTSYRNDIRTVPHSILYRLPLDGGAPSAIRTRGAPVDQFSFQEDHGTLNVLVQSEGAGDAMWASEAAAGAVALAHVPLDLFRDGSTELPRADYRTLPTPDGNGVFQNRFVGDHVLYGQGNGWGAPSDRTNTLFVAPLNGGKVARLPLPYGIDRIEAMGRDAIVIGSSTSDTVFSAILLSSGRSPAIGAKYVLSDSAQSETRSHGFFFKPDASDPDTGVLGLPVSLPGAPGYKQLSETSAAIVFLRRTPDTFAKLGEVKANDDSVIDDHCVASCVDWYGNARPIFAGGRVFGLMGYELVEGTISATSLQEIRRVNFAEPAGDGGHARN